MQYYVGNATAIDAAGHTAAKEVEPLTYVTPVDDEAFLGGAVCGRELSRLAVEMS